jgi:hypothetical protein
VAIASDTRQVTSGNHNDTPSEQNDQDLSHKICLLPYDAATSPFGFNEIQGGASLQSASAAAFQPCVFSANGAVQALAWATPKAFGAESATQQHDESRLQR